MKREHFQMIRESLWIPIILSIFIIAIGIAISEVQTHVGWKALALSLAICYISFTSAFIFFIRCIHPVSIELLHELKADFRRYAAKESYPNIVNGQQLAEMEASKDFGEIWLITADMINETPGKIFHSVVDCNLKKGIEYIYFIPKKLENTAKAKSVSESHKCHKGLKFVFLPDDFFFLSPRLDFAIYDPLNKKGLQSGYMGLPIDSEEQVHGLMTSELLEVIIGRIFEHLTAMEERV